MTHEPAIGRVIITWPKPREPAFAVLPSWGVSVHDADTGEQLLDVVKFTLVMGSDSGFAGDAIAVDLTRLLDSDGEPAGTGRALLAPALTEEYAKHLDGGEPGATFEGQQMRIGVFRYFVAEMRIGPPIVPSDAELTDAEVADFQQRWDAAMQPGVTAIEVLHPDPDAVIVVTVPDDWTVDQHEQLAENIRAHLPNRPVLVYAESVGIEVRPADPAIPTRESVNRGEHTINQYREHHGTTDAYPEIEG